MQLPGVSAFFEFETSEVVQRINRLAQEAEIASNSEDFTNARRVGWLLKRLRFTKATAGKTRRRWKVKITDIAALAHAYGMNVATEKNAD